MYYQRVLHTFGEIVCCERLEAVFDELGCVINGGEWTILPRVSRAGMMDKPVKSTNAPAPPHFHAVTPIRVVV